VLVVLAFRHLDFSTGVDALALSSYVILLSFEILKISVFSFVLDSISRQLKIADRIQMLQLEMIFKVGDRRSKELICNAVTSKFARVFPFFYFPLLSFPHRYSPVVYA